ncbi:MAG: NAD(P)-dependent oxidoreductase [Gemmatimonadetes bacterium]|nr:NAD(P)-dependent oxidoreductase [Gemmatimonadota bacterium]
MTPRTRISEHLVRAYADRKVIVLGASGFIGRWVAWALTEAGARLTLLVRAPDQSRRLFDRLGINGEIRQLDLRDLGAVEAAFHQVRPTVTFNLAGYGVDRSERDPEEAHFLNTDLVGVLCRIVTGVADDWQGLQLIHAGTALEYGMATGDLNEDTPPEPTTLYGRSKLAGTHAVQRACRESGLRASVARLFTVYGPGEHQGRLFPALIRAARTRQPLPLTAGHQLRDFTYVEDVAAGLMRLGAVAEASGQVVNLATGKLLSVLDFALQTAQVLRLDERLLKFGQLPVRGEEMAHNPANINRLTTLTGWRPPADIQSGVERTLARIGCGRDST